MVSSDLPIEQAAQCLYEHDRSLKVRRPMAWELPSMEPTRVQYRARAQALADAGLLIEVNDGEH